VSPQTTPGAHRDRRWRYRRMAIGGFVVAVLAVVYVFTKPDPFANTFTVRAQFASVAQLHNAGQVRIAGIQVGDITGISAGPGDSSIVTMAISSGGLPIHRDATFTIKPRLVLEGNAYIDVDPGTPAASDLRSGDLVPEDQTATTVQLDQVLDTFDIPVRQSLSTAFKGFAQGFGTGGAAPGTSTPGWAGLKSALHQFDTALGPAGTVAESAEGTQPGDLGRAIGGTGNVTAQLAADPAALADAVTSYNATFAALASQSDALAASVSDFDGLLKAAPRPLAQIDAALPTLTRFAHQLQPTFRAAPAGLRSANGLLDQIGDTVKRTALPRLVTDLGPLVQTMPTLENRLQTMFSYSTPVTDCITTHIVPSLNMVVPDGSNSTGDPVYLDLVHLFTGLTGFSSAVDGNGGTVRLGVTTGDHIIDTILPGVGQVVGRLPGADGVDPEWLGYGVQPPYRPDQSCAKQPLPNLAAGSGKAPAWASGTSVLPSTKGGS
jgi:ABC-type transporter Mla subunit MlaD